MASDARLAKLLGHIAACHSAVLPGGRLPFYAGPHHIGYMRPAMAAQLAQWHHEFTVTETDVHLALAALPRLNEFARELGLPLRDENFDVRETPDGRILGVVDRGALPSFGVIGVGAHLNGLVRRADGLHLWVGRRAADKKLDPGKLDHLVAGGVAAGMTPLQTLLKEGGEEASLPETLAAGARLKTRFSYNMERPEGLRRDVIYAYDLELPDSFQPIPADGEVEEFMLWPLRRVLDVVCSSDDFKFNVNLVLIDLCIRHGLLDDISGPLRGALGGG